MTNAELIQKIRAEIISRIDKRHLSTQARNELVSLLSFLDTLESEKPNTHLEHVPEIKETDTQGLDEAAKNYALNTAEDSEQYSARYLGYKDGAKWQKEQDNKELSEKIATAYQLGIAHQKEQMLKEAVECDLYYDGDFLAIDLNMAELGYSERENVRIIIVKE